LFFSVCLFLAEEDLHRQRLGLLGLLGVEHGDKSSFFLNLSGNFREEARRDLPVLGVEQLEKSSSLESSGLMVFKNFLKVKGVSSNRVVGLGI